MISLGCKRVRWRLAAVKQPNQYATFNCARPLLSVHLDAPSQPTCNAQTPARSGHAHCQYFAGCLKLHKIISYPRRLQWPFKLFSARYLAAPVAFKMHGYFDGIAQKSYCRCTYQAVPNALELSTQGRLDMPNQEPACSECGFVLGY